MRVVEVTYNDTYDLRERVLWPGRPDLAALPQDATGSHWAVVDSGGDLLSVVSVFLSDDKSHAQFRKFATEPGRQGQGHGSRLLTTVTAQLRDRGVRRLWCNARTEQEAFYERRGLRRSEGSAPFLKNGVEYVQMEVEL